MTINFLPGFIEIHFEEKDWDNRRGGAAAMILGIKKIGHVKNNPHGWTYNQETKTWTLVDTAQNRTTLRELKKQYIDDPRQLSMISDEIP